LGFENLLQERDRELLRRWLQESHELYLDLDRPHSGGANDTLYLLTDVAQLDKILAAVEHPEVCLYIFRHTMFPIRGEFDEALLATAISYISEQKYFCILSPDDDPPGSFWRAGGGTGSEEMHEEFRRLRDRRVLIGQDPFDEPGAGFDSFFSRPDEVFVLGSYLYPEPHVKRNQLVSDPTR
jgi:hypothetical protein